MTEDRYIRILSIEEMRKVYNEHMTKDFPDNERKPFSMIEKGMKKGTYECPGFFEGDELKGYSVFVKSERAYLFDYLAVIDGSRNSGIGADFLKKLFKHFEGENRVIGEVEDYELESDAEKRALQKRRYDFYIRNGYVDTGVKVKLFSVDYRILEMDKGKRYSWEEISKLYKGIYKSFLPWFLYIRFVKIKKTGSES